ncbi:MAG: hypothetical protein ACI9XC_001225 [Gammaproteobacteria bacterium]|jgi:hypothetical protein
MVLIMNKFQKWLKTNCAVCAMAVCLLLFSLDGVTQILNDDYAAGADALILKNEISIFSSIQEGVKLSVAECEIFDSCNASVNRDELNQLITTIDGRINSLSVRYSDSGETALEEVLIGYVDIRDSYNVILERIESLPQFIHEEIEEDFGGDDFFGFGATTYNAVSDEIQQMFEDVDEEIIDDDIIIEDESSLEIE